MILLRAVTHKVRIDELAFAPDGAALYACGGANSISRWAAPWTATRAAGIALPVRAVTRLAVAADGTVYAGNDELVPFHPTGGAAEVAALDPVAGRSARLPITPWASLWFGASPDGSRLVVVEQDRSREGFRLTGWRAGDWSAPEWSEGAIGFVWAHPLFPAGGAAFVLIEHRRDPGRRWHAHRVTRSAATGAELDVSPPLADIPEQVALSPDGGTLACRTRGVIRLYPAAGPWADVPQVKNDSRKHFTGAAFHPSGRYLAATSNDASVKLYDAATWQPAAGYTWNVGRLRSVAFSPDGTLAAAGGDGGKVVLWDVDL